MLVWRAVGSFRGTEQEVEQKIQIYARCKRKQGNVDQCLFYWTTSLMGLISEFLLVLRPTPFCAKWVQFRTTVDFFVFEFSVPVLLRSGVNDTQVRLREKKLMS